MKERFLLESIIGPRTLETALQLTASVALYAKDKKPPLILIDDHLPYPQAILRVFGDIKHCRRKNGRGRFKHPRLKWLWGWPRKYGLFRNIFGIRFMSATYYI